MVLLSYHRQNGALWGVLGLEEKTQNAN